MESELKHLSYKELKKLLNENPVLKTYAEAVKADIKEQFGCDMEGFKIIKKKMEGCTKPNCDCFEKAIEANGGNEIKSGYPCLHFNISDMEKSTSNESNQFSGQAIKRRWLYDKANNMPFKDFDKFMDENGCFIGQL
jgi:hypothetical protein